MRKKIAILGSTGSIGKSTLDVISKNRKNFDIVLLSANNNYKKLIQQAKKFKARNVIIKNELHYQKVKKLLKKTKIKVFSGDIPLSSIISEKLDFTMSAIVGLAGLHGSKMLFILPLLGTLIGGLWGGFELYNRLLEAEDTLANLKPEAIQKELVRLTELTEIIKTDLREDINVARDETQVAMDLARATEKTSADTQREIRNDVYAMERDMNNRFKEMDSETRELRKDLEDKIMTILENPLNDTE